MQSTAKRVTSWVYNTINPIIEGLRDEIHFLSHKNLTWRYYSQRAEYIFPIQGYIDYGYLNTYEHYARDFPEIGTFLANHDELLKKAETLANQIFTALDFPNFIAAVGEKLHEYTFDGEYPGGAIPREKFHCLVIQHLVNEEDELPAHCYDGEFWRKYQAFFREIVREEHQEIFAALAQAKNDLLACSQNLQKKLQEHSYQLCKEYDIPADQWSKELSYAREDSH